MFSREMGETESSSHGRYRGSVYKRRRPAPGAKTSDLEIGQAIFWDTNRMEFMRRWAWSLSEDAQILSEYREVRGLCGQGRWR